MEQLRRNSRNHAALSRTERRFEWPSGASGRHVPSLPWVARNASSCSGQKWAAVGMQAQRSAVRGQWLRPPAQPTPRHWSVSMLVCDPELACSRMFVGAHVIPFISTKDQFGCCKKPRGRCAGHTEHNWLHHEVHQGITKVTTSSDSSRSVRMWQALQAHRSIRLHPARNTIHQVERCLAGKASMSQASPVIVYEVYFFFLEGREICLVINRVRSASKGSAAV